MESKNYLQIALKEAEKAYQKLEAPIGAVIVKDGRVIAKAHNLREKKQNSLAHAEIIAIKKACEKLNSWRLDGCDMYVTLEPCAMCTGAITQARIRKVYFGARDEKNGCIGSIANMLEDIPTTHKTQFEYIENEKCSKILTNFFKELRMMKKM